MSKGNCTAVDVDPCPVPIEFFAVGKGLSGECLVHLDQVKVAQPHVRALKQTMNSTAE